VNAESIQELESKLSCNWSSISNAREEARSTREKILKSLNDFERIQTDQAMSIVVFGSLARDEWTNGSDIDWTLLIDGLADAEHRRISHQIGKKLEEDGLREPGPTGVFGDIAFSHDIIHQIGGQEDTNCNTTRRILLLLESIPVGCNEAYKRVIRSVLMRYLEDDASLGSNSGKKYKIPRFLLNDIVRYWRTMAVDYAHKRFVRASEGWAIRNIKLRMSRKLIFVSGLLTCFGCYLKLSFDERKKLENHDLKETLVEHLFKYVNMTPLEIVAKTLLEYDNPETSRLIMNSYNQFLTELSNEDIRNHLKKLELEKSNTDEKFNELCGISRNFQEGLSRLFFEDHQRLSEMIKEYGVF